MRILSIEGNVGSGKSTFLEELKKYYANNKNVVILPEPVDVWDSIKDVNGITMLEKFYADQEKYAFSFQMMAYISRLAIIRNIVRSVEDRQYQKDVFIPINTYLPKCSMIKVKYAR